MALSYFANKTIWITGASSGIGEGFAKELSSLGAYVILSARRKTELERVQNSLIHPDRSEICLLDMEDSNQIDLVSKEIQNNHQIDIVILNAGISQRSQVISTDFETEQKIMNINFHGLVRLAKQVLPEMLRKKSGHFVIMSSVAGKLGIPGRSTYSASKHALHGYFDALRAEVSNDGITVSIVCPGYIFTNISQNAVLGNGQSQNKIDDNSKNGMKVEKFISKALKGIARKEQELLIGGKEVLGVYVKRFFPRILNRIIKKVKE